MWRVLCYRSVFHGKGCTMNIYEVLCLKVCRWTYWKLVVAMVNFLWKKSHAKLSSTLEWHVWLFKKFLLCYVDGMHASLKDIPCMTTLIISKQLVICARVLPYKVQSLSLMRALWKVFLCGSMLESKPCSMLSWEDTPQFYYKKAPHYFQKIGYVQLIEQLLVSRKMCQRLLIPRQMLLCNII